LFAQVKAEWDADPDNWRASYRLARAYDYAGDRSRAREIMRRAVALERWERSEQRQ
jgi:Flp pilus assembly protein TadD